MLTRYADYYHFLLLPTPYSFPSEIMQGDLNLDGKITEADAVLFSALLAEHPAIEAEWINLDADLNENGILDAGDLQILCSRINYLYNDYQVPVTLKVPFLPWYSITIEDGLYLSSS